MTGIGGAAWRRATLLALTWATTMVAPFAQAQKAAPAATPAAVPVESFFRRAKLRDVEVSPSGRWLAALTAQPGRRVGLMIIDLEGKEDSRFVEVSPKDDVDSFTWVSDDWIVCGVVSPMLRSTERVGDGLLAVKRDGSSSRLLISRIFEQEDPFQRKRYLEPDHRFMSRGAPGTNEVIVGQWQYRNNEFSHITLKVMDVATGGVRSVPGELPRADSWLFDHLGRPRVARLTEKDQTTTYWADKTGAWRVISKAPTYRQPFVAMAVVGEDELLVNTAASGDGSMQVRRFDFAANAPSQETLVETPGFDDDVRYTRNRRTGELLGMTVFTDAAAPLWFRPAMKAIQDKADAKFAGSVALLYCQPCDGKSPVVAYVYSDVDPGNYVLYQPQTDKWRLLGEVQPDIDPRQMQPLEFHRIKARDGQDLPLWVTRARQTKPAPAPAVMLVHGGPGVRGREGGWAWGSEAQFLASRGYVVIEPEFRGSKGYGAVHERAGWKQWGGTMQDDVTDALRFGVAQGWVDAKRVCIMGGSYGGYATLMGLVKDPDQYRCGVAYAAVSDPRHMFDFHWNDIGRSAVNYDLPVLLGDRQKDDAKFAANSPVVQASRIKAPILLSHGGQDRRVPIDNAERMLEALRKNGKQVEWVPYPEEIHGFFFEENRFDYYRKVEAFLARHLQP